jgi:branched-chain amino acid transport system permease protein
MPAVSNAQNPWVFRKSLLRTFLFALLVLIVQSQFDAYNQGQLALVLMLFIGTLSVMMLTGISGQLSLGQGALMAVGGYSSALLMANYQLSMWVTVPAAMVGAAIAGLLLGIAAARLSGPYLAGTTLVIALAIPSLANRFFSLFKGDEGLEVDIGYPPTWLTNLVGEVSFEQWQLFATLPFALIALFIVSNILLTRRGRVWRSIRDNQSAAALSGVNYSREKVIAFIVASAFAGVSGALYGLRGFQLTPSVYPISLSLTLLTAAVLGGIRSIAGAFIGTVIVVFLPDWIELALGSFELRPQISDFLPSLISSLLLVLTVVINPAGVMGTRLHKDK